jgi:hypothetical protein
MRIKLDENLPVHLAAILTNLRHDVHTVAEENLSGKVTARFGKRRNKTSDS